MIIEAPAETQNSEPDEHPKPEVSGGKPLPVKVEEIEEQTGDQEWERLEERHHRPVPDAPMKLIEKAIVYIKVIIQENADH